MEWKWLWVALVAFLLGGLRECQGCFEQEKIALLQLKPFFNHIEDVENYWVEGKLSWDCCKWKRVECNTSTGRVTRLFLNQTYSETLMLDIAFSTSSQVYRERDFWYLNSSLFLPFEDLRSLYLGGNSIVGFVDNQGFERLSSKLDKLEILDLRDNHFNDSILASLSELSSLKSLSLAQNQFTGSNPTEGIERLSKLNKLETLDLLGNMLGNNVLSHLQGFKSLKLLRLQNCRLKGTVDAQEFNNLLNLKELYLGQNEIESFGSVGTLFQRERQLKLIKLEVLGLTQNLFSNSLFSSLAALSNLKFLYIRSNKLEGPIYIKELNALTNLEELHIEFNKVTDFVPFQDNETELRLMNLEVLELSGNLFHNISSLLSSLGRLSSLKSLVLLYNKLEGSIDLRDAWSNLEELNVDCRSNLVAYLASNGRGCSLTLQSLGFLPALKTLALKGFSLNGTSTIQSPLHLKNLEGLYIEEASVENNFLPKIVAAAMPSLKSLVLRNCVLNGTMHTQGFCEIKNLQNLQIDSSNLTGNLPECFSTLTSLKYFSLSSNQLSGDIDVLKSLTSLESLDLSSNQFSGNISALRSLKSLQALGLSNNNFEIPSSFGPLLNLSKLLYLYADNNTIYAETEMHSLPPKFQLQFISLSWCENLGSFPQFLYHQHDLWYVDLSNINFKREQFPIWLLKNNTNLGSLLLSNNSFLGYFELPFLPHTELSYLDISKNYFYGNIPNEIGAKLPSLSFLNMSTNYFGGNIPVSIGDLNSLNTLDLSNNKLTGEVPEHLAIGCSALDVLILSNNSLQGHMFSSNFSLIHLLELHMDENHFSGRIPDCLSNCSFLSTLDVSNNQLFGDIPRWMQNMSYLSTLDVSNNKLSGEIPRWMGNMSSLEEIVMANNHLEGPIPMEFCHLNLNLSGTIPPCLKITTLNDVSQDYVRYVASVAQAPSSFSIEEPVEFTTKSISYSYRGRVLTYLSGIDLSCNKLTGGIPREVKNLQKIHILNLSHNSLTGSIPPTISELRQIESLDLSYNNLSGQIPSQIVGLYSLSFFSVAYNNLSGRTPVRTAQFATFEESSYRGNPFLCGSPLPNNCSTSGPSSSKPKASSENGLIDMNVFYVSFGVAYIMVILTIASVLYINPYWRRVWFYHIEAGITSCYYFVEDNILPKRFHCGCM